MSTLNNPIDVKQMKEELIERRGANRALRERALRSRDAMAQLFATLTEEKIAMAEAYGVNFRPLLSYDLERASKDREYNQLFVEEYNKVLSQIQSKLQDGRDKTL